MNSSLPVSNGLDCVTHVNTECTSVPIEREDSKDGQVEAQKSLFRVRIRKGQLQNLNDSPSASKLRNQVSCLLHCNEELDLLPTLPSVKPITNTSLTIKPSSVVENGKLVNDLSNSVHIASDENSNIKEEMEEFNEKNSDDDNDISEKSLGEKSSVNDNDEQPCEFSYNNKKQCNGKRKRTKNTGVSFRLGAYSILKRENKPLNAKDIVAIGLEEGLFSTSGKTPHNTLAALLYCDIKKNKESLFTKVKAMTFGLKEWKSQ